MKKLKCAVVLLLMTSILFCIVSQAFAKSKAFNELKEKVIAKFENEGSVCIYDKDIKQSLILTTVDATVMLFLNKRGLKEYNNGSCSYWVVDYEIVELFDYGERAAPPEIGYHKRFGRIAFDKNEPLVQATSEGRESELSQYGWVTVEDFSSVLGAPDLYLPECHRIVRDYLTDNDGGGVGDIFELALGFLLIIGGFYIGYKRYKIKGKNKAIMPQRQNIAEYMYCSNCGTKITRGDDFCANCGAKLSHDEAEVSSDIEQDDLTQISMKVPAIVNEDETSKRGEITKCIADTSKQNNKAEKKTVRRKWFFGCIVLLLVIAVSPIIYRNVIANNKTADSKIPPAEANSKETQSEESEEAKVSYKELVEAYQKFAVIDRYGIDGASEEETEKQRKDAFNEAVALFDKATDSGCVKNTDLLCDFATLLQINDKERAINVLKKAAELGSPRACRMLGFMHNETSEGEIWINRAIELKDPIAIHAHANLLWSKEDKQEALNWYIKAADEIQGYKSTPFEDFLDEFYGYCPSVIYCLEVGYIYENGLAGVVDQEKALEWYQKGEGESGLESKVIEHDGEARISGEELADNLRKKMR